MVVRLRRRDRLIAELAGQLADSRAREAALAERLEWYKAAVESRPLLRAVRGQAPRSVAPAHLEVGEDVAAFLRVIGGSRGPGSSTAGGSPSASRTSASVPVTLAIARKVSVRPRPVLGDFPPPGQRDARRGGPPR